MIFRFDMIPTALRAVGRFLKRVFGPEPIVAADDVLEERRERCFGCHLRLGNQCSLCGCIVETKTLLASEKCPRLPSPAWTEQTRFSNGL